MKTSKLTPAILKALAHIRSGQVYRDSEYGQPYSCWFGVGPASIMKVVGMGFASFEKPQIEGFRWQAVLTETGRAALGESCKS